MALFKEVSTMRNLNRWSPIDEVFDFQREMDRVFNQFWNDLPTRTASSPGSFQVNTTDDGWVIDVPLPGVDPQHVNLEVAGNTLQIRVNQPAGDRNTNARVGRFEQTLTIPQFLDVDKLRASHRHGMLQLTLPLKESVKPRRIEIAQAEEDRKQLTTA
jgi:HSP20 family protein